MASLWSRAFIGTDARAIGQKIDDCKSSGRGRSRSMSSRSELLRRPASSRGRGSGAANGKGLRNCVDSTGSAMPRERSSSTRSFISCASKTIQTSSRQASRDGSGEICRSNSRSVLRRRSLSTARRRELASTVAPTRKAQVQRYDQPGKQTSPGAYIDLEMNTVISATISQRPRPTTSFT